MNLAAFRLNDLQVDPAIGLISGPGGNVHLEPRVMGVLQTLGRRAGELVSRRELLAENWPGGDIYDEALTQCIYQLRRQLASALGGGEHRNLISTVPKRGFILNAHVRPVEPDTGARLKPVEPSTTEARYRTRPYVAWAIAVLPFLPLVQEQSEPELELGMADTLIARLSKLEQIVVRPIAMVRGYGAIDRDSIKAGKELGVDAVVEGSIQKSGELIRVTARVLRVADGTALWIDTFDEPLSDIFAMQDDICARIADALALRLGPEEREDLALGETSHTEAYLLYLKGRFHLARLTPAELLESIDYFRKAIALDPNYAEAWLGLANAQFRMPLAGEAPPREFYPQAKAAAIRALEIDDRSAEGHAYLGWIAFWFERDWAEAEDRFKRALSLNPNDFESHLGYAHLLSNTGRHEAALLEVRRARELGPFSPVASTLEAAFLKRAGRHEASVQRLEEVLRNSEKFWLARVTLANVYSELGRYSEALTATAEARKLSGGSSYAMATEINALAKLGRHPEAEALLNELLDRSRQRYVPPYDLALAYIGLDDADTALGWLEQGFVQRDPKMSFLSVESRWDTIRTRPEFVDLLRRMNLLEAEERNQLLRELDRPPQT